MSLPRIYPIVLCGGSGKRLWPASRKSMPKQFARIASELSLLQETVRRIEDISCEPPIFLTCDDYRFIVFEQLAEIGASNSGVFVEPESRNTGPSVAAAAEMICKVDPSGIILVFPADHMMDSSIAFGEAVLQSAQYAREGKIVTFGVRPNQAETGYGYIELTAPEDTTGQAQPFVRFVEKPDAAHAEEMVQSGKYLWNSGIYMATADRVRAAFARHAPELQGAVAQSVREAKADLDFLRLGPTFTDAPSVSLDHAIMEHETGIVVPLSTDWSDLGTWRSVWTVGEKDDNGVVQSGEALSLECQDTLLKSEDDSVQIVGIGLRNIAAIATRDAVLITDMDCSQSVATAVGELKKRGAPQAEDFRQMFRPWGHYETLALGSRFQVKSIVVRPGGQLSLQSHVHRAEHWVVVEGTAAVTVGRDEKILSENESIYIPLGEIHRLANPGKVELRLIEVQTGAYLGEDDIMRYEDIYDRV